MSVITGRKVKVVTADGTVQVGGGVVRGIAVTKVGATDTIELKDGTGGAVRVPAFSASGIIFIPMNVNFNLEIYANVTGTTAEYLIIYD